MTPVETAPKRQTDLVPYMFEGGWGRIFISSEGPVTADMIEQWQRTIKDKNGLDVAVMGFFPVEGEP